MNITTTQAASASRPAGRDAAGRPRNAQNASARSQLLAAGYSASTSARMAVGVATARFVAHPANTPTKARLMPTFNGIGSVHLNPRSQGGAYWRIHSGPHRGKYLHRVVFQQVAGRAVREGFEVHHMNGINCVCPHQLVEVQACLHWKREPLRDPYTGVFLSKSEYQRRYGAPEREPSL